MSPPRPIHVIPIYLAGHAAILRALGAHLAHELGTTVVTRPLRFDPESSFDASRGQYNSTQLLAQLLAEPSSVDARVLGVVSVDLFIPILTYLFGEAQLDGRAAVVSMYRLDNALYGLPPAESLLGDRLIKEATHELGHTFGLVHCHNPGCVMASSTYVEDIDLKSAFFCTRCRTRVRPDQLSGDSG